MCRPPDPRFLTPSETPPLCPIQAMQIRSFVAMNSAKKTSKMGGIVEKLREKARNPRGRSADNKAKRRAGQNQNKQKIGNKTQRSQTITHNSLVTVLNKR